MIIINPTGTVLYLIEQFIKEYPKFSQHRINQIIPDNYSQCLVQIIRNSTSNGSQKKNELIFKDYVSFSLIKPQIPCHSSLSKAINHICFAFHPCSCRWSHCIREAHVNYTLLVPYSFVNKRNG